MILQHLPDEMTETPLTQTSLPQHFTRRHRDASILIDCELTHDADVGAWVVRDRGANAGFIVICKLTKQSIRSAPILSDAQTNVVVGMLSELLKRWNRGRRILTDGLEKIPVSTAQHPVKERNVCK